MYTCGMTTNRIDKIDDCKAAVNKFLGNDFVINEMQDFNKYALDKPGVGAIVAHCYKKGTKHDSFFLNVIFEDDGKIRYCLDGFLNDEWIESDFFLSPYNAIREYNNFNI